VALPDAFTRFGGCQYLSSAAVGDYETYLLHELRHRVEERYRISAHAIAGKSSGGFGALVNAMRHPHLFDAVVCHSGDMGFELALFPDLRGLMDALRDHGGVEQFVAAFDATRKKREGRWFGPMAMLALAAVFSPSPGQPLGIGLPFDLARGTLDDKQLARWLVWDPVRMIERPEYQRALSRMKLVYLDCGSRDEHGLHWGALALHTRLAELGVAHRHESFDDGHRNTSHRLDVSLPLIFEALGR
jgi:S-formylglutathione hydrolase FrmB